MSDQLPEPAPGQFAVGGLAQARRHKRRFDAVLTIEDPRCRPGDQMRFTKTPRPPHLVLQFEDADREDYGYATATAGQVEQALAFARTHAGASLLVPCLHGVGRSAGLALAILAERMGPSLENEAFAQLITIQPAATPNLVVVELADALLSRNGALIRAVAEFEADRPDKLVMRARRHRYALENPNLYASRG